MPLIQKPIQGGQTNPNSTSAEAAVTVSTITPSRRSFIVRQIVVCNTTALATTYSLYHDDDGTTYDSTTALIKDASLPPNTTHWLDVWIPVDQNGTFGVESGTANAVNFTIFGDEVPA